MRPSGFSEGAPSGGPGGHGREDRSGLAMRTERPAAAFAGSQSAGMRSKLLSL
jgi:hypothetical protein